MNAQMEYTAARELLLQYAVPLETERVPLAASQGRVLAQTVSAAEDVPPFDRSAYDGYALRACDTEKTPVTLRLTEEIAAGFVPTVPVTAGTAAKILTGAPIPEGADAVIPFEMAEFTDDTVTVLSPVKAGANIVRRGEDVLCGTVLAPSGTRIDAFLVGTLAAQGIAAPCVYRRPRIGLISTGSELAELTEPLAAGKIRNTGRYVLAAALEEIGCTAAYLGTARDRAEEIAALLREGLRTCDAVLLTGGVSVGDYDLTPAAMELSNVRLLVRGVALKPGMACAYGVSAEGKLVCGLSGNPASAMTNFYAVVLPALRRLCGLETTLSEEIAVTLTDGFGKKSKFTRILRGKLELKDGTTYVRLPQKQGNAVLSSAVGCDVMVIVPSGSGPLAAGTRLKGFLL